MSITALIVSAALTAAAPPPQADPHTGHHPEQMAAPQPAEKTDKTGCPMMKNGLSETGQMGDHLAMMKSSGMMAGEGMHAMKAGCAKRARHGHHKRPAHH
jgi:hypothetical protein